MPPDVRWDLIRYANVWEDADILCRALAPAPGRRICSIASGGDNAFALLAEGAEVVAVDINPAQLAVVELKREAIRHIEDREELLAFLGELPTRNRPETYARIRDGLSPEARAFWDGNPLGPGVMHLGKFEGYFRHFRTWALPLAHGRAAREALLTRKSLDEQRAFYDDTWNTWRWRLLFQAFFNRTLMGMLGRDPAFFEHVEGSVAKRILERTRHALTAIPTHSNPYLQWILNGRFGPALPRYLRPDVLPRVRAGLDRLHLEQGPVQAAEGPFDGFNLSDLFEYLDTGTCETVYGGLLEQARPGARLAYWNMLVPRRRPARYADRVEEHLGEAEACLREDRAWFYSAFRIEEVR